VLAALRSGRPAVIGHIVDDAVVLDLRTIDPDDDPVVADAVRAGVVAGVARAG
jgi:L-seryl-tRNA(Ser) seleniumtransferase